MTPALTQIITRLARVAFFIALVFTLYMALDPAPMATPTLDSYGDKVEHMLAFGTLTFLARLGFAKMPNWLILERLSFIGALIEVFQAMPAVHRDCDWHDWIADSFAIVMVLLVLEGLHLREFLGLTPKSRAISWAIPMASEPAASASATPLSGG